MRGISDINKVIDDADDAIVSGDSKFHGMSYEEGVKAALLWVIEDLDENPLED